MRMLNNFAQPRAEAGVFLTFLGAVGTTTGSCYLLQAGKEKILVDCGLFKGKKNLRLNNWTPFPIPPAELDAVVLTQSRLENSGYLPRLVKQGFKGKIYCSEPTGELCSFVLNGGAKIEEDGVVLAKEKGFSRHVSPRPLFTLEDVERTLKYFETIKWDESFSIGTEFKVRLHYAGHILGAAHVLIEARGKSILFSGCLGRPDDPLFLAPSCIQNIDYLIVESTHGGTLHPKVEPDEELLQAISPILKNRGIVLIVGSVACRVHLLISFLLKFKAARKIPDIAIYLEDSFAISSAVFEKFPNDLKLTIEDIKSLLPRTNIINSKESIDQANRQGPAITISGKPMATGGPILHQLKKIGADANNLILFIDYQAPGTRGADLIKGARSIKIHGLHWPIRAQIKQIKSFSSNADYSEILDWIKVCRFNPAKVFITHGEPKASVSLKEKIENQFYWPCLIPELGETVCLTMPHKSPSELSIR